MRIVHLSTIHQALDVRIFYKECLTLVEAGYEVHLLVAHPPEHQLDGVFFHSIDRSTDVSRLQRIWRRLSSAYHLAVSLRANIYHFHDPELIPVGVLLKFLGFQVIYDVHEDAPWEAISLSKNNLFIGCLKFGILTILEQIAIITLDAFVCVTPKIAQKFPSEKTIVVRNFPLKKEFNAIDKVKFDYQLRKNQIIYVGGISIIRAIQEIVQAMELIPEQFAVKLVLIGNFFPPILQNEMERYSGWQNVKFLGWQPRSTVITNLSESKVGLVILYPEYSFIDSLPIKLFEYMAAGLPVIASDFPLWRKIIEEVGCGILVDPLKPQEIAEAIKYLLENQELAAVMGEKGRQAMLTQYNWENEEKSLTDLYRTILMKRQLQA